MELRVVVRCSLGFGVAGVVGGRLLISVQSN